MLEEYSYEPDAKFFRYEHNAWYVTRNTLTTLAEIVLSFNKHFILKPKETIYEEDEADEAGSPFVNETVRLTETTEN